MSDDLFRTPKKPVDGYEIKLWRVEYIHRISEWRAVYHVDTPFENVSPKDLGSSASFTDQWAIFYDGRLQGRSQGWDSMGRLNSKSLPHFFKTEQEAKAYAAGIVRKTIERSKREVSELSRRLAELEEPTPLDIAVRQLFADMAKNYQDYDIIAGWGVQKGTPEGNAAETALDVVIQELLEKAIAG